MISTARERTSRSDVENPYEYMSLANYELILPFFSTEADLRCVIGLEGVNKRKADAIIRYLNALL